MEATHGAAFALAGGGAAVAFLYALWLPGAIFRAVPPDSAGRLFDRVSRGCVTVVASCSLAAVLLFLTHGEGHYKKLACSCAALIVSAVTFSSISSFMRARDVAMREPSAGTAVESAAVMRSHQLLSGIRGLMVLTGAGLVASVFL